MSVRVRVIAGIVSPLAKQPEHSHEYVTVVLVSVGGGFSIHINVKLSPTA